MRIDVISDQLAKFKSFRIIANKGLEEQLLSANLWPKGVRIREYSTNNDRSPYVHTRGPLNTNNNGRKRR